MAARSGGASLAGASGGSAIARDVNWRAALEEAVAALPAGGGPLGSTARAASCDLAFLFASSAYADEFDGLIAAARAAVGAATLVGCSGQGVIAAEREVEGAPALALATFWLPGASLTSVRVTRAALEATESPAVWHAATGLAPADVNAWVIFADPFTLDAERLIDGLADAYPSAALIGGLASGDPDRRRTHLFIDDAVHADGAVLLAVGGAWTVRPIVSQGCSPIGEPWTVTDAHGNVLVKIGGRPAYEVLVETLRGLPPDVRDRAARNLLVGLAMDEYRDRFRRGDFLIRNLLGIDRESGALAVGAYPRVGQTVQFQMRDREAADEDLRLLLAGAEEALGDLRPAGALLCTCNGRGVGLFGVPDHDARLLANRFDGIPIAGFFCNGEIGPVGARPFLHGFTASIGLFVPNEPRA